MVEEIDLADARLHLRGGLVTSDRMDLRLSRARMSPSWMSLPVARKVSSSFLVSAWILGRTLSLSGLQFIFISIY